MVDLMNETEVDGCAIERLKHIRYVGMNLLDNSSIACDVNRCCDSFLRQLNGINHKLKFFDINVLFTMFISYCMSLFGIEKSYEKLESQKNL